LAAPQRHTRVSRDTRFDNMVVDLNADLG